MGAGRTPHGERVPRAPCLCLARAQLGGAERGAGRGIHGRAWHRVRLRKHTCSSLRSPSRAATRLPRDVTTLSVVSVRALASTAAASSCASCSRSASTCPPPPGVAIHVAVSSARCSAQRRALERLAVGSSVTQKSTQPRYKGDSTKAQY
jgi:hypothetical protein